MATRLGDLEKAEKKSGRQNWASTLDLKLVEEIEETLDSAASAR